MGEVSMEAVDILQAFAQYTQSCSQIHFLHAATASAEQVMMSMSGARNFVAQGLPLQTHLVGQVHLFEELQCAVDGGDIHKRILFCDLGLNLLG